jgi:hypothetical protein
VSAAIVGTAGARADADTPEMPYPPVSACRFT